MKRIKITKKTAFFGIITILLLSTSGSVVYGKITANRLLPVNQKPTDENHTNNRSQTSTIEHPGSPGQEGDSAIKQQSSSGQSANNKTAGGSASIPTSPTNNPPQSPPPLASIATGTTIDITTANYTRRYGTCASIIPATQTTKSQLSFNITNACNPSGDGHFRTDWSNVGTFSAGTTTCSSLPIYFPSGVPSIGSGSWWQFAEAKTPPTAYADWGLYVHNKFDGSLGTEFDLRMAWVTGSTSGSVSYGTDHPSLWHGGNPSSGWNTFVVCSNYSTTNSGFLDLYLNGSLVRSMSGVAILQGQTTDDLDINDYTGGSPANITIHGAPMIGTTLDSVKQTGGWNSAP